MSFEYSCFFSYRHVEPEHELYASFNSALHRSITSRLAGHISLPPFWDTKRITGGYHPEKVISDALCKSVCMIMVYTKTYFDAPRLFCAREYFAMLDIQRRRFDAMTNGRRKGHVGLVIPIEVRGKLPEWVKSQSNPHDFTQFGTTGRLADIDTAMDEIEDRFVKDIESICVTVRSLFDLFDEDACPNECLTSPPGFKFPTNRNVSAKLKRKRRIKEQCKLPQIQREDRDD